MNRKKLIVIGGGAAGFFAAIKAKENYPALEVVLLEKQNKFLQKVKVSGGGRCNVTHAVDSIPHLLQHYPRGKNFLKKVFYQFGPEETIDWFANNNVKLHTESDGRMFPSTNSSQTIIDCLTYRADDLGVQVKLSSAVTEVKKIENGFKITVNNNKSGADYLCVACGGYPKSSQFDWLRKLGHKIIEPVPSLFTFNIKGNKDLKDLMGVSLEKASIRIQGTKANDIGPLLITHWGLSGPCVLKLSAWQARALHDIGYEFSILVNWINQTENELRENWNKIRNKKGSQTFSKNPFELPKRLWLYLIEEAGIREGKKWSELASKEQNRLIAILVGQHFEVKGKTTFKEEFVTCGGIDLKEVNPKTMESRVVPNLFFAGEVLDIDGVTGGFNFQNAWSTAAVAGKLIQ